MRMRFDRLRCLQQYMCILSVACTWCGAFFSHIAATLKFKTLESSNSKLRTSQSHITGKRWLFLDFNCSGWIFLLSLFQMSDWLYTTINYSNCFMRIKVGLLMSFGNGPPLKVATIHPGPFFSSSSFLSLISLLCTSLYLASRAVVCSLPEVYCKRMQRSYSPAILLKLPFSIVQRAHLSRLQPPSQGHNGVWFDNLWNLQIHPSLQTCQLEMTPSLPWDAMEVEGMVASLRFSSKHPKWIKMVCLQRIHANCKESKFDCKKGTTCTLAISYFKASRFFPWPYDQPRWSKMHTPHATVHSSLVWEPWFAWHSMQRSMMWLRQMAPGFPGKELTLALTETLEEVMDAICLNTEHHGTDDVLHT